MFNDPWIANTQKHMNDYYLEKYKLKLEREAVLYDKAKTILEDVGYQVYDASHTSKGPPTIGYHGAGCSGILFSVTEDSLNDLIKEMAIYNSRAGRIPQDPIVLQDSYKELYNWFRS